MGVCCNSRTVRDIIKKAGLNTDSMIKSIIEFQKEGKKTPEELDAFLETLKNHPYIFIGANRIPHKLIYNRTYDFYNCVTISLTWCTEFLALFNYKTIRPRCWLDLDNGHKIWKAFIIKSQINNKMLIFNVCSGTGGISIGNREQTYKNPEQRQSPQTVLVLDNFNVVIGNARWGKEQKIDVVHVIAKPQEIFAPSDLSRATPSLPLDSLTGFN